MVEYTRTEKLFCSNKSKPQALNEHLVGAKTYHGPKITTLSQI